MSPHAQKLKHIDSLPSVATTLKHLAHPNIISLLGIMIEAFEPISDLMPNRDLLGVLQGAPMRTDTSSGIFFVTRSRAIHGDLNMVQGIGILGKEQERKNPAQKQSPLALPSPNTSTDTQGTFNHCITLTQSNPQTHG